MRHAGTLSEKKLAKTFLSADAVRISLGGAKVEYVSDDDDSIVSGREKVPIDTYLEAISVREFRIPRIRFLLMLL